LGDQTSQLGGADLNGKIPLSLMTKGGRFIIWRGQRHGSRGALAQRCRHGSKGSMSDMILVLIVSINAKGGYFLLIGLVVIDVNP
jgi:hypothetical protein